MNRINRRLEEAQKAEEPTELKSPVHPVHPVQGQGKAPRAFASKARQPNHGAPMTVPADLTAHARQIAGEPAAPPTDPMLSDSYADPENRQKLARGVLAEVREHYALLHRLLVQVADAAANARSPGQAAELARTAVAVQGAAGRCLAAMVSLGDQIGELEGEAELRRGLVEAGYNGPRRPLVSVE